MNKVYLMQLMELPVSSDFDIQYPDLSSIVIQTLHPDVDSVYHQALEYRPEIKSAEPDKSGIDIMQSCGRLCAAIYDPSGGRTEEKRNAPNISIGPALHFGLAACV